MMTQGSSRFWLWGVPVLLLVAALGIAGLDADSLWYDEWLTIWRAGHPYYDGPLSPAVVWERTAAVGNYQLPAYYFLVAAWGNLAGLSEFGGRAVSFFVGLVAVALTYRTGRDLASPLVGLGAAVTLGLSAFYVDYLHEMRAYTLYALFTVLSVWAYWRITHPTGKGIPRWLWLALAFGLIGLLYTHYFGNLMVAVLGLYHVLFVRKNRLWWLVLGCFVVAGLLYLPWAANTLNALIAADNAGGRKLGAMDAALTLETLFYYFSNGSIALLAVIVGYGLLHINDTLRPFRRQIIFAGFLTLAFLVIALVANVYLEILTHVRYLMPLWILMALLVGFGVEAVARQRMASWLLLGVWIVAGVVNVADPAYVRGIHGTFVHLPFRELTAEIASRGQPGDVVALHVPDYNWLREPTFHHYMHDLPVRASLLEELPGLPGDEYVDQSAMFIGDAERVWLAVDKTLPPTFRLSDFQQALALNQYAHCATMFDLPDMELDLYARADSALHFGGDIGVSVVTAPVVADGELSVVTGWTVGEAVPANTYSVGLHVLDSSGALVAQADSGLPAAGFTCQKTEIPLAGLSVGEYTLVALVYNWQTGERLTIEGERTEPIELGTFELS